MRLDSDVRAELDYAAGLLFGVIEEVGVGCDHRAAPRRAAPRRSGSIERKGKKSFRQTRIPEASRRYKDQGSMISGAMIFRILRRNTVKRFNVFPGLSSEYNRA